MLRSPASKLKIFTLLLAGMLLWGCSSSLTVETLDLKSDAFHKKRIALLAQLKGDAKNPRVLFHLGVIYYRMKRYSVAETYLDRARMLERENADIILYQAFVAQKRRLYMTSLGLYQSALEKKPALQKKATKPYSKLLRRVARRYQRYRQFDKALTTYQTIEKFTGKLDKDDRAVIGSIYLKMAFRALSPANRTPESTKKAISWLTRAQQMGVVNPELYWQLGLALLYSSQNKRADKQFALYLGDDAGTPRRLGRLARRFLADKKPALAIRYLETKLPSISDPKHKQDLTRLLAETHLALGHTKKAVATYRVWIKLIPADQRMSYVLQVANSLLARNLVQQAGTFFRKIVADNPKDLRPFRLLLIQIRQGRFQKPLSQLLRTLIENHPRKGWILERVGNIHREGGQHRLALGFFNRALKASPPYRPALLSIARLHHLRGQTSDRDAALKRWISGGRDKVLAHKLAGDLMLELQERELAIRYYKAVARMGKSNVQAALLQARIFRLKGEFKKEDEFLTQFLANSSRKSEALFAIGRRYYRFNDVDRAVRYLEQLVKNHKDTHAKRAILLLADIHSQTPKLNITTATGYYQRYIQLSGANRKGALELVIARVDKNSRLNAFQMQLYEQLATLSKDRRKFYYQLGMKYLKLTRFTKSQQFFDKYIERAVKKEEARLKVGLLFAREKSSYAAFKILNSLPSRLLLKRVKNPDVHKLLGNHFRSRGQQRTARKHYLLYVNAGKLTSYQAYRFGNSMATYDMCDLALKGYQRTGIDLKPLGITPKDDKKSRVLVGRRYRRRVDRYRIYLNIGRCFLRSNKQDLAEKAFDAAIAARNNSYYYYTYVGRIYYRANYLRKALKYYEKLFDQKHRGSRYVYRTILDIYQRTGQHDKVQLLVDNYLKRFKAGRYYKPYRDLAKLLARYGLYSEAIKLLKRALVKKPDKLEYRQLMASYLIQTGKLDIARTTFEDVIRRTQNPGQKSKLLKAAGYEFMRRGYYKEAIGFYNQLLKSEPQRTEALINRGVIYTHLGQFKKAKSDFTDALSYSPRISQILHRITGALKKARRYDIAIDLLNHLIILHPKKGNYRLQLAKLYESNGKMDNARQAFLRYIQQDKRALVETARFFRRQGDIKTAKRLYLKAFDLTNFHKMQTVLRDLYEINLQSGKPGEMDRMIGQYLMQARDKAAAYQLLINLYQRFNRNDKVLQYQARLKKLKQTDNRYWRALDLLQKKQYSQAVRIFRSLIIRAKTKRSPYRLRYRYRYRYRRTRYRFSSFNNTNQSARQIISLLILHDRLKDALNLSRLATSLRKNNQLAYQRISLELMTGKPLQAIDTLRQFLRTTTRYYRTTMIKQVVKLFEEHGLYDETLGILKEMLSSEKSDSTALQELYNFTRIKVSLRRNRNKEAKKLADSMVAQKTTKRSPLLRSLGQLFLKFNRPKPAMSFAMRILKQGNPRFLTGGFELAVRAAWQQGDKSKIESITRLFLRRSEDKVRAYIFAARLHKTHGLLEQALTYAMRARELQPTNRNNQRLILGIALRFSDRGAGWKQLLKLGKTRSNSRSFWESAVNTFRTHHRYDLALRAVDRLLKLSPGAVRWLLYAGKYALFEGQLQRAQVYFQRYLEQHSNQGLAAYEIAHMFRRSQYSKQARRWFKQALKSSPGLFDAMIELLHTQLQLRDESGAFKLIDRYMVASPSAQRGFTVLVWSLIGRRYTTPAVLEYLGRIRKQAKGTSGYALLEAYRAAVAGRTADLKRQLTILSRSESPTWRYLRKLAVALLRAKKVQAALLTLDTYSAMQSSVRHRENSTKYVLRTILWALRTFEKSYSTDQTRLLRKRALALTRVLTTDGRTDLTSTVQLAMINELSGDIERAIWVFKKAIRHKPGQSQYYNNLAYMLARRNRQLKQARKYIRMAIRINADQRMYYIDTEGWVLFKQGRIKDALKKILHAMRLVDSKQLASGMVEYYYHLGLIYRKLGDKKLAIKYLRQAVIVDPDGFYGNKARVVLRSYEELTAGN